MRRRNCLSILEQAEIHRPIDKRFSRITPRSMSAAHQHFPLKSIEKPNATEAQLTQTAWKHKNQRIHGNVTPYIYVFFFYAYGGGRVYPYKYEFSDLCPSDKLSTG